VPHLTNGKLVKQIDQQLQRLLKTQSTTFFKVLSDSLKEFEKRQARRRAKVP